MTEAIKTQFEAGVQALRDGRTADAQSYFEKVLTHDPEHAPALYNLAAIKFQAGKAEEAENLLTKALHVRPGHIDTQSLLAAVFADQRKFEQAVPLTRALLENNSADAGALNTAGRILAIAGWSDEAERAFCRALEKDPKYRLAALGLVNLLLARRAFGEAVTACNDLLRHRPTDQDFHLKRAQALWESGQTAKAQSALRDLLDFSPDHVTAHYNLSLIADPPDAETTIRRLAILLAEGDLDTEDTIKSWFALGNLFVSLKQFESGLACFAKGNDERSGLATSAHALSTQTFERRVKELTAAPLPPVVADSPQPPTPLIITGPSRSGKSVLQAWLSGYSDINAADETGILPGLAESAAASDPSRHDEAALTYRNALVRLGGQVRYVIDTHPLNTLYLDLLLRLCPDAKIIQIHRDPLDLAVSTFLRHFVSGGYWADTWPGIAKRLRAYDVLQSHWQSWSPVAATVAYEDLVSEPVKVLKVLISALDLPWMDDVLPPQESDADAAMKAMPWASFNDRPSPHTDTVGLWAPFAPWLAAFANAYGRESLCDGGRIPADVKHPTSGLITGFNNLKTDNASTVKLPDIVKNLPAVLARQAEAAERQGRFDEALKLRWQAVSYRPFTHHVRRHADALRTTLQQSEDHSDLAVLHRDVTDLWNIYRSKADLHFGDFELPYQSCTPVMIAGSRDTDTRISTYDLASLAKNGRVLNLGSTVGFLTLAVADEAKHVVGVEKDSTLTAIAERVRAYLRLDSCTFESADVMSFDSADPFDLVIAAALHGWLPTPLTALAERLARLTNPGGALLFESQGRRSTTDIEENFTAQVTTLTVAGFTVEREGQICDDRVNLRAFVVLRRTA